MSITGAFHHLWDYSVGVHPLQDNKSSIFPSQDHSPSILPLQDHVTISNIDDCKKMFPDSFDKVCSMPGKYRITSQPNILPVQHGRCRVPIEAKEKMESQLIEMIAQGIITSQVKPTPWVSSLTYHHKSNGTLGVCNSVIICKHHKTSTQKRSHIG